MNLCARHGQYYPLGSYCVYCGPPRIETVTATWPVCPHEWYVDSAGVRCGKCGAQLAASQIPTVCSAGPYWGNSGGTL